MVTFSQVSAAKFTGIAEDITRMSDATLKPFPTPPDQVEADKIAQMLVRKLVVVHYQSTVSQSSGTDTTPADMAGVIPSKLR